MAGCKPEKLNNVEEVEHCLVQAAREAKATVLDCSFHKFSPQGVSGVVVIAESHISIHTWPEFGYAAVDVFTCGDRAMPKLAASYLIKVFAPKTYDLKELPRGIPGTLPLDADSQGVKWSPPGNHGWA